MADLHYLDPAGLARLGNMELVAKQVVEGFLTGRHRSPYHGFSVEYLDHRAYTPGDDLRTLDWKMLARSDKYYVKLFEDETNLRAYILLDCSQSMAFKSGEIDKLTYGAYLAAALSYLLIRQNDAVGLVLFDTEVRSNLPPRAHPSQYRRILETLENIEAGGETNVGAVLHEAAEQTRRRGLIIVISDLIDNEESIADGLQHFRHNNHEVLVFHTMDEAELTFPYDRQTRFQDMEGAGLVSANPKSLRKQYMQRLNDFLDRLKGDCSDRSISYNLVNTSEPYDRFLAGYLDKRARIG
ncbi:MAG: DUF58 domain-containing protein [Lentisphaeria bacterium]|jgi:uncharacterized protein (DUF58 family)|nr:DUF58 domain-containing protein [Lentisphaeria bacterium]